MAKSSAKKYREKRIREGKRNPELSRGVHAITDLRTRLTKTKSEKLRQNKHKGRYTIPGGDGEIVLYTFIHLS